MATSKGHDDGEIARLTSSVHKPLVTNTPWLPSPLSPSIVKVFVARLSRPRHDHLLLSRPVHSGIIPTHLSFNTSAGYGTTLSYNISMSSDLLSLRAELKYFEREFKSQNGHAPSVDDIKDAGFGTIFVVFMIPETHRRLIIPT